MVKVPIMLGPDCFQSPEVGAFEISMQCSLFFFHNIWCWLCESQHTSGISGSWPQGFLNVKHLGAPMTKLEWREIAPPCEKSRTCVCPSHFTWVAGRFSFIPFMSVVISSFECLDVWCGELISFGWLGFTTFIFATIVWRSGTISWDPHYSTNLA